MLHFFLAICLFSSVQCFTLIGMRPRVVVHRGSSQVVMGGAKDGPFTPLVKFTKRIMGEKNFLPFRAKVISKHTEVIQSFVETSDSPFGCMALEKLFEL